MTTVKRLTLEMLGFSRYSGNSVALDDTLSPETDDL